MIQKLEQMSHNISEVSITGDKKMKDTREKIQGCVE